MGYCIVCSLIVICFVFFALCYVLITCFMFIIIGFTFVFLFCMFCFRFCVFRVLCIVSPHVHSGFFSVSVQVSRPLQPGRNPVKVNYITSYHLLHS